MIFVCLSVVYLKLYLKYILIQGQGFMVGVQINPVSGLPSGFPVVHMFLHCR